MRFYAAVLAVLFAIPAAAQFQERLEVRLLELEATVLDKQGRPVERLTREDFLVTLDGKPTDITNFSFVRGGVVAPAVRGATPAPSPEAPLAIPTRIHVIFDDLHLHPPAKQRAIAGLREYFKTLDASTTASLMTWSMSLHINVKPTSDSEALLRGLDAMAKEQPRGMAVDGERRAFAQLCEVSVAACRAAAKQYAESQALDAKRTFEALREVIDSIGGTDGRKLVFFISEGVPMNPGTELYTRARGMPGSQIGSLHHTRNIELKELATAAQNAGVVFNTIDPSIGIGAASMMNPYSMDLRQVRDNGRQTGAHLARETGGQLIVDQNDLNGVFSTLEQQVTTFYSLAVRAPERADEAKVEVRLRNRNDLRVLTAARRSLSTIESSVASTVRAQLYQRQESNPLDARLFVEEQHGGERCTAAMSLLVPKEKIPLARAVDVRLAVLDDRDRESDVFSSSIQITPRHGSVIGQIIPVHLEDGGKYVLSVGIIDRATGITSYLQREVDCTQ